MKLRTAVLSSWHAYSKNWYCGIEEHRVADRPLVGEHLGILDRHLVVDAIVADAREPLGRLHVPVESAGSADAAGNSGDQHRRLAGEVRRLDDERRALAVAARLAHATA